MIRYGDNYTTCERFAASGFTTCERSAASGFTTCERSAASGFTVPERSAASGFTTCERSAASGFTTYERSTASGFTLIELMVAVFIFALLATAGVSLLSFSTRTQAATNARLTELSVETRMTNLLASDFAQALSRPVRDTAGATVPAFVGTNGVGPAPLVRFTRTGWSNPDDAPRASIQRVELSISQGRFERRTWTMADGGVLGPPIVLADRVDGIDVRYRDQTGWRSDWAVARPGVMPRAIEFTLRRSGQEPLVMAFLIGPGS